MLEVVDLAGRIVNIPTGDVKVILGSSLMIYAIAPLFGKDGNPFTPIVGWNNSLDYDPDTYEMYLEKFPDVSNIPNLGSLWKGDFSIEKAISLNANIILTDLYQLSTAREIGMIEKLDKAGIKTVFLDFGQYPTQHTVPSILLLGQIFEKTAEASKFINYYFAQMQKVYSIVDSIQEDEKPLVFLESAPNGGWSKAGDHTIFGSNWIGHLVKLAGGRNYGTEIIGSKTYGTISAEQLLTIDPDVIIGTGGNWSKLKHDTGAVLLGYKATKKGTQERLKEIVSRPGWKTLEAVKNKRVHIIYHAFSFYPAHFIPVQQMAKWIYPEKFADLDPEKTFIEFHDKFLPISYSGMFWVGLE